MTAGPYDIFYEGRRVINYEDFPHVMENEFPCHRYFREKYVDYEVSCSETDIRHKNAHEADARRRKSINNATLILGLFDNTSDLMNKDAMLSTFFTDDPVETEETLNSYDPIMRKIDAARAKFNKKKEVDIENSLDEKEIDVIIETLKNMQQTLRVRFAKAYLKRLKELIKIFSNINALNLQEGQGTKAFVREFTEKMKASGYDPKNKNSKLQLSCTPSADGSKTPFAYQIPVPSIIRPENPDVRKMLVLHRTGAGKTITILKTLNNFFFDVRPKFVLFPKENVRDNFYMELMSNPAPWNLFRQFAKERLFHYMYTEGRYKFFNTVKKIKKLYDEKKIENDEDLINKLYTTEEIGSDIAKDLKEAIVNILAGEDRMWQKMFANNKAMQKCVKGGPIRLKVDGTAAGCITNFPWSPLRALSFHEAGGRGYTAEDFHRLYPIATLPKVYADGTEKIEKDFKKPLGIGSKNEKSIINSYNDKILLLDEIHVLMRPSRTDYYPIQIENMKRLIKCIRQVDNSVVVAFTATPITDREKDGRDLLDTIKGNEFIKAGDYGFVSYMMSAPKSIYPRVIPGEISLGKIMCVTLKGTNLKRCAAEHKKNAHILNSDKIPDKKIVHLQNYVNLDVWCGSTPKQAAFVNQINKFSNKDALKKFAESRCTKLKYICDEVMNGPKQKTLILIEEKMGMYPLASLLKKMVELCGGECYPVYCTEKNEGGCFIEMWDAKKGLIPRRIKEYKKFNTKIKNDEILNAFNSSDNQRGENIMCIIADARAFTESTSFKQVRRIILANPATAWSTHKQRVGRVLRACVYSKLPENERQVEILTFVGKFPNGQEFQTLSADALAIKKLSIDMKQVEKWMKDLFEDKAIDRELLSPLIGEVPKPITRDHCHNQDVDDDDARPASFNVERMPRRRSQIE
ncbi:MAG: hypothetical protein CMB20_004660 [Methanobacteriota archaeon]|nr:MAG: hypothetical protein CMB20_004660 [Euryarchaeota archaeon]|tara:strand:- start:10279 stop:13026 length:2748 start_codon:yes stop_codon:yes gene_type:complete